MPPAFQSLGTNCLISEYARFYGAEHIRIGNHVRIDDFCVLSAGPGGITIGDHVHIAAFCSLIGREAITLGDFSNLSSRVSIYSISDDFSGASMTNPTIPEAYKQLIQAPVIVGRHVVIGSGSVILPGVELGEGAAVGALSLVKNDCDNFSIYAGCPARRIKGRQRKLLEYEALLRAREPQLDSPIPPDNTPC